MSNFLSMIRRRQLSRLLMSLGLLCCITASLSCGSAVVAQDQQEMSAAEVAMMQKYLSIPWQSGPVTGAIGSMAEIKVPAGFSFTGAQGAQDLLEAYGNPRDPSMLAAIVPEGQDADWTLVFQFDEIGYVDDSDRDALDADALIKTFRAGIPAGNQQRRSMGLEELNGMSWAVPPFYDPQTNNLTWALKLDFASGSAINYDIRVLGRRGVMQATLIGNPDTYAAALPQVKSLLANYSYNNGSKYAEWTQGERVAGVGLAGLVAGGGAVAAAKLGLFGKLGLMFAKAGKAIALGVFLVVAAAGSFVKRLFGGGATST